MYLQIQMITTIILLIAFKHHQVFEKYDFVTLKETYIFFFCAHWSIDTTYNYAFCTIARRKCHFFKKNEQNDTPNFVDTHYRYIIK